MTGLILISQVQRSGGTLMTRLLDGHPEIAAHPGEMLFAKGGWPNIMAMTVDEILCAEEKMLGAWVERGYLKGSVGIPKRRLPFDFDIAKRRALFEERFAAATTPRAAFDAYSTSFFEAWGKPSARYHAAFAPEAHLAPGDFFKVCPDGLLISIIRHPESWLASAQRHHARYHDVDWALYLWGRSLDATLRLQARYPDRVMAIVFERLVADTEAHTREIADKLGIEWLPCLNEPTFGGTPVRSDSSFYAVHGIDQNALNRSAKLAADVRTSFAMRRAVERYEEACAAIHAPRSEVHLRLSSVL